MDEVDFAKELRQMAKDLGIKLDPLTDRFVVPLLANAANSHVKAAMQIAALQDRLSLADKKIGSLAALLLEYEKDWKSGKAMRYQGVWQSNQEYQRGDAATKSGGLWYCKAAKTKSQPGMSSDWQLTGKTR